MLKNKKIEINLHDGATSAQKFKLKSINKRLKKSMFAMSCRSCGAECNEVCFAMLRQFRVNEIEIAGGKSDFLYSVDTTERPESVPLELYQQLLQSYAELKGGSITSTSEASAEPMSAADGNQKAKTKPLPGQTSDQRAAAPTAPPEPYSGEPFPGLEPEDKLEAEAAPPRPSDEQILDSVDEGLRPATPKKNPNRITKIVAPMPVNASEVDE